MADEGRPTNVYGLWRPQALEHDVGFTEFAMCYRHFDWIRGNELERNCDGIVFIAGEKFLIEFDTSEMSYSRVAARWKKSYLDCEDKLLVVTTSQTRVDGIIRVSEPIREFALFCVLEEFKADPHGPVWQDVDGETYSITHGETGEF